MQLPSGLYSQYTEVLDSSPLMKYNLERKVRVEAENQAKEEALNRYFADQLKTYNEAGLRTVHNSGLNKKVEDIQKYWNENSQAIKSGGEARSILDEMFRDASFYVSGAKQRDKTLLEIAKARSEGKLNINKEDMKKVLSNLEKGFDDQSSFKPDGSDWGWMDLSASAPELDAETEAKTYDVLLKNMTPSERDDISRRVTDKVTGEVYTPRIREFTKEQKLAAALSAPSLVIGESDAAKSFRKSYDQILNNPNKTQELEELDRHYKSVFGNDKPFISTPEQVAQAKAIKRLADAYSEKPKEDLNRQQAQQYKINNIIASHSGVGDGTQIRDVFKEISNAVSERPSGRQLNTMSTTAQSVILKQARDLMGDNDLSQSEVYLTQQPDGRVFIRKTSKPRVMSPNDIIVGEMDFTGTNIGVQPGVKEKRDVVELGKNSNNPPKQNNKKTKVYKGLDKSGNPIFE